MKLQLPLVLSFALAVLFSLNAKSGIQNPKEIRIGTTAGDFADLARNGLKPELEKLGYKVHIREFTDYVTPNLALADGSLDLNIFQHKPYLDQFSKDRRLNLKALAPIPTAPLGLYAGRTKSLDEVRDEKSVALPNDPTNLSRALTILADLGWIELDPKANPILIGLKDVKKNTRRLNLRLLEAAQIPRVRDDVDFAIINGNFATSAGISLNSALAREKSDLYINWIVTTPALADGVIGKEILKIVDSDRFQKFARSRFSGYKFPANWK